MCGFTGTQMAVCIVMSAMVSVIRDKCANLQLNIPEKAQPHC